ncbi:exported hypothetical protein [Verrucomicrobia bacterium]|nr:exported hypothetical protein [Verrucomicrobiota bacterium]
MKHPGGSGVWITMALGLCLCGLVLAQPPVKQPAPASNTSALSRSAPASLPAVPAGFLSPALHQIARQPLPRVAGDEFHRTPKVPD